MGAEMQIIYQVEGKLCRDFIGQISYTVCLEQTYDELDIEFSFGPQHFQPGEVTSDEDELDDALCHQMKTEIHTIAMLNDEFIGGIHRQLTTRHMHFTKEDATEGCIPQPAIEGVLKVIILAFSVLVDNTEYSLTVRAR